MNNQDILNNPGVRQQLDLLDSLSAHKTDKLDAVNALRREAYTAEKAYQVAAGQLHRLLLSLEDERTRAEYERVKTESKTRHY